MHYIFLLKLKHMRNFILKSKLLVVALSFITALNAQINVSYNFNTNSTGWTGNILRTTATTACGSASMRRNLYSTQTTGNMVSPLLGTTAASSTIALSYKYKIANWSANTVGTPNPWGNFVVQYGATATGPWTTFQTVDQTNHIVSGTCTTSTVTFVPPPSSALYIRWFATWSAGDYYINFDDISVVETAGPPPTCGAPSALNASGITATSANFTWTASATGTPASYDWEVRTSGAGGSGATGRTDFGNVATNSASTSLLSGGVTYNLYVRTNCTGAAGSSTWAGPFTFVAPIANDDCSGAITLNSCSGVPQSVAGSTSSATVDAIYTNCGAGGTNTTERGVWYKYVGDNNSVTMTTCDASGTGYDTRLTVYSGSCGSLTCVSQNDDMSPACATGSFRSQLNFNAFAGTDYYIFVHGYQTGTGLSAVGNFILNYSCTALCVPVPANETCASASAYGTLPTTYTPSSVSNNCAAAAAVPPSTQSAFGTYPDIWYSFVYPTGADAVVRIDLNGTATAAGIELYGSCGGAPIANVASVNSGTAYVLSGLGLVGGQTYYLQIYSPQANRGSFDFGIYYEPCATPLNGTATNIGFNQADLGWTSAGTLFDIELGAFGFTPTGIPTVNDVSNPYTYTGLQSNTQYTYYVRQDCGGLGTSSWNGPFTFSTALDCSTIPAISACGSAVPVAINSGNGSVDVACSGFGSPGREVYYSFTPSVSGNYTLSNSSSGGSGGTLDYVHAYFKSAGGGCGPTGWTSVYCDFLANDGITTPTFALTAGTQYFFLFDGETTNSVTLNITLNCPPPPPVNDVCSGAIAVSCGQLYIVNTISSTDDAGLPATCNTESPGFKGLWYTYVGTGLPVSINVCSDGTADPISDTKLTVYTGSCGSYTCLTANDDTEPAGCSYGFNSSATILTQPGVTYYIYVAEFDATTTGTTTRLSIDCGTTWLGNTTDWFTPSNWSPSAVPNSCAVSVRIPTTPSGGQFPTIPNAASDVQVGNLLIEDGASVTLQGRVLSVCGNFAGGTGAGGSVIVTSPGSLTIGSSPAVTPQFIGGNSSVDVLRINNTAASGVVNIYSIANVRVNEELRLEAGALNNTSGGSVILGSTASRTANLNDFCGGCSGTYTGNITAERFIVGVSGTTYNQHHIGSPVNTPAVSELADDLNGGLSGGWPAINNVFVTPVPTCNPDFLDQNSNYGNVFEWEETGPQGTGVFPNSCYQAGFKVRSAGNMDNGVGYVVNSPAANLLDVTGSPNTGNITVGGLTNSGYTNSSVNNFVTQSGWNELANPYPSSVSLAAQAGIDPGIAVWHTSGEYTGTFQPSVLGVNADLAPWQGFWARKTGVGGTASFNFTQSQRTTAQNVYYMTMGANTLLLKAKGFGYADATYVQFDNNATQGYDLGLDVEKVLGGHKQPRLFTYQASMADTRLAVNAIADGAQNNTIPVVLMPGQNGSLTFEAHGVSSFDPTQYILLEDKVTATMQDLRSNPNYTFSMTTTENPDRFVLHFTPPAKFTTTDVTCNTLGTIQMEQPGDAVWSFAVTDANNTMISSGTLDKNNPQTISAAAGVYTITMIDNNGYIVVKNISISGAASVLSSFNVSSTSVGVNQDVNFFSNSNNSVTYSWDFGDGSIIDGIANPIYSYQTEGTYVVTLTVTNTDGCISTSTQTIVVSKASSVGSVLNQPINLWSAGNKVFVDFTKQKNVNATIEVFNILGQQLVNEQFGKSSVYMKEITNTEAAYVLVRVNNEDRVIVKKLFITNK